MYLSPLRSISALLLVLDELVPCEYYCSPVCNAVLRVPVHDRSLQCRSIAPYVFLRTSCTRLRMLLVGIDTLYKIAPPVYHPTSMASRSVCAMALLRQIGSSRSLDSALDCLRGQITSSLLSSVNVGQTL